jgi:titin
VTVSGSTLTVAASVAAGTYNFTITASNGRLPNATQAFTLTVTAATTVPAAPGNFNASPGDSQVALTWTAPSDGGSPITRYEVSSNNGSSWVTASSNSNHTFTGLNNGTSYTFKVRAVNAIGNGAEATTTATPVAAIVLTLTVSPGTLSFSSANEMQTFAITSNTDWSISSNQSWLTVSPASGSGDRTITVTAGANTAATQRTATITISGTGASTQYVNVTQAADLTAVEQVGSVRFKAYFAGDVLKIESAQAETIAIYSISGSLIKTMPKKEGAIDIPFPAPNGTIWIIKGSVSGSLKIIRN